MSPDGRPIVVGGCFRSGTSLVRRILDAHSRIHCGPEVKFFRDFYGDYRDDPFRHLRFTTTARSLLPEADLLEVLGRAFIDVHERAARRAGKPRWADKNPENVLYLAEWQRLLGDRWVFIHVVRNPLDTLASIKDVKFPLTVPADLDARIALYRRYTEGGLRFARTAPDRYHRILYESLAHSPEATLREMMRWLGETFEPVQLAFNREVHQTGLEDPKIAHTSEIHAESIRRWPLVLTREEAAIIWRDTQDLWAQVDPHRHDAAASSEWLAGIPTLGSPRPS